MITIRQLMIANREEPPVSISQDLSVFDALKLMAENNVGAVLVVDENVKMVGIFTERDYARKIILLGRSSLDTPIQDIMSRDMVTVHPEQSLEEGMELMTRYHIRHLPVSEEGRIIGMVSMRDIVAALLLKKDEMIGKLEGFILGTDYNR